MKCNACTEKPKTAADLDRCSICRADGTANEVPKDMPRDSRLEDVIARKPGLSARFTPEPSLVREEAPREEAPAPTPHPRKRRAPTPRTRGKRR